MTLVWFVFISFMSINLMNTAPFDSFTCITDEHANILTSTPSQKDHPEDYIPELHDIPISIVNAMLYQGDSDNDITDHHHSENSFLEYHASNDSMTGLDWPVFDRSPLSHSDKLKNL